jgi:hypothetical protein
MRDIQRPAAVILACPSTGYDAKVLASCPVGCAPCPTAVAATTVASRSRIIHRHLPARHVALALHRSDGNPLLFTWIHIQQGTMFALACSLSHCLRSPATHRNAGSIAFEWLRQQHINGLFHRHRQYVHWLTAATHSCSHSCTSALAKTGAPLTCFVPRSWHPSMHHTCK